MSRFAIDPPIYLGPEPERPIETLDEAARIVRRYASDHVHSHAERVLHRLEGAKTPEQAREAIDAFRAWADDEGFLSAADALPSNASQ